MAWFQVELVNERIFVLAGTFTRLGIKTNIDLRAYIEKFPI